MAPLRGPTPIALIRLAKAGSYHTTPRGTTRVTAMPASSLRHFP